MNKQNYYLINLLKFLFISSLFIPLFTLSFLHNHIITKVLLQGIPVALNLGINSVINKTVTIQ